MSNVIKKRVLISAGIALSLFVAIPAYAIFAKLSTSLKGTAVAGVTPSGNASVDQASYPTKPGILKINVSKVNVPSGTVLGVNISDCPWYGPVAYLKIVSGSASLSTALPANCQVGRLSTITVTDLTTVYLKGGNPWKI